MAASAKVKLVMDQAPEAETEEETEAASEDETRLAELIDSKRARLAALETEREEYKRVRAHLGDLMARNLEASEQTARDIEGLEELHRHAALIRMAITLG